MKVRAVLGCAMVVAGAMLAVGQTVPGTGTAPATTAGARRGVAAPVAADKPSPRMGRGGTPDANLMNRHTALVARAKAGNIDLYMLGDSITDGWQNGANRANMDKNLGGWKPGDFGIGGDRTENVLWRITNGELDGVTPKVVMLMIGTNNLGNTSAEDTAKGVKAILDVLREKQPQAKILLLAIFPRNATAADPLRQKVNATNELIAKLDDGKAIKYLNINEKFLDKEGNLSRDIMPDLLHPNAVGYQIWADAVRPQLTEWLGPPAAPPATPSAPATGR